MLLLLWTCRRKIFDNITVAETGPPSLPRSIEYIIRQHRRKRNEQKSVALSQGEHRRNDRQSKPSTQKRIYTELLELQIIHPSIHHSARPSMSTWAPSMKKQRNLTQPWQTKNSHLLFNFVMSIRWVLWKSSRSMHWPVGERGIPWKKRTCHFESKYQRHDHSDQKDTPLPNVTLQMERETNYNETGRRHMRIMERVSIEICEDMYR